MTRTTAGRHRSDRTEHGVVAVWTALVLTTLLLFLGMGLDVGLWYYQGWKQQQAADQAALAGAVFLPDHPAEAIAAAKASAAQNGYGSNVDVVIGTGASANRIKVSLSRNYGSTFSRVSGKTSQNILRSGTAEYVPPLSLGSPFARLGNDPEDPGASFNYWLSQHGPWVPKHQGDRFAADNCVADMTVNHPQPYGCTNNVSGRGANTDYARLGKYGYRYSVDVPSPPANKDLVFEVFDGVTANTGNLCNWGNLPTVTQRLALGTWLPDADLRYRSGTEINGMTWCTGEATNITNPFDASRNAQYMDTEFAIYSPTRSVATGALVQNTTPPTTAPPQVTTTLGGGGGNTVAGPCSPVTTTGPTTLHVNNDRATNLEIYLVNASCQETLVATGAPAATTTINTYAGYRYRWYDATTREFVGEYIVATPAASGYARRSLAAVSGTGWAAAGAVTPTVAALGAITDKSAATFEVIPAVSGTVGCVTFRTAEATPRYLSYVAAGAALAEATSVTSSPQKNAASWCPTTSGVGLPSTRFSSVADPTAYLWRDPATQHLGAQTTIATPTDLEWWVMLPLVPGAGEPIPTATWVTLITDSGSLCAESNGTAANVPVNLQTCSSNATQQWQLQPATGSNLRIQGRPSSLYLRPAAGATAAGTGLRIENLGANSADEWAATLASDGRVSLQGVASGRFATGNCGTAGQQLTIAGTSTGACDWFRVALVGAITPVSIGSGSQTIDLVVHLNNTGTCSLSGGNASLTVTNPRSGDVGVYGLDGNCDETFLGTVAAGATTTVNGLKVGQRVRFSDVAMNRLVTDLTVSGASSSTTLPTNGPGTPCSGLTGAAASVTFRNLRTTPVRIFSIDSSCNVINVQTLSANSQWTATTYNGAVWRTVDTLSGATLRTLTVSGSQTVSEYPETLTSGNCSPSSGPASSVTIVNLRTGPLELFAVDDTCREVSQGQLAAGGTTTIAAFLGQRWKIYDAGTLAEDVTLDTDPQTITVEPASSWSWDPNAGNQSGSVLICSRVETAYPLTAYTSADSHSGTAVQLLNPSDGVHDNGGGTRDTYAENFTLGFRRWRQFCRIPAASVQAGRYTLTVRTNLNDESAGNNSFSLRAVWVDPSTSARSESGIQLSALENFPVYVNLGGSSTSTLYLTRLRPVHAGRQLRIELFDIGDTSAGTVNVQVIPPPDANVGASWPCSMKLVSADGTFNPPSSTASSCSVNGLTRTDYNGAAVQFTIPVPSNFTCDESVATNCWARVVLTFSGGQPTDRTTWSAAVLGDPLRIVH